MKVYRVSPYLLVFLYSLLTILTLGGLAVFILGITGTTGALPAWLMLLWLGLLAWVWFVYLTIPYKIFVQRDHTLEFRSFLRQTALSPQDIVAIRGMFLSPGFLKLRHTGGALVLTTQVTGMHEIIALIRKENPAVEVVDC